MPSPAVTSPPVPASFIVPVLSALYMTRYLRTTGLLPESGRSVGVIFAVISKGALPAPPVGWGG